MKLFETSEAGGTTVERAQIVRLDSRWIALLRYHLGTAFEECCIAGESATTQSFDPSKTLSPC